MFLVIGAGGPCGRSVSRALKRRNAPIRGFVRNAAQVGSLTESGIDEVVVGDLRSVSDIRKALAGVAGVFHIGPRYMPEEAAIGVTMVEEALSAGVPKFAYLSALHPIASHMLQHDAKRIVEERLVRSDLDFTILQPARFMQNIAFFWKMIHERSTYIEPSGTQTMMSLVDFDDVAEVAAIALTEDTLSRGSFQLSSAGEMSRAMMAETIGAVLGRPIGAAPCSFQDWAAAVGWVDHPYLKDAMRRMFEYYDAYGFRCGNDLCLRTILGRPPNTFRQFMERFSAAQAAAHG